ncbi:protein-glutamine gamma-glutamyltransferase 2-like [Oreochromis aureus]|uniref:Protein-glutamine gamma-glutamyltransferase 2 n=1 Tax=Oreochromis aureus TaxID=47969 RepID=A0A668VSA5_OREAU|nr:protein-glutamine gamma-glutamyltransferase 2-like [Oreochromis aureus]
MVNRINKVDFHYVANNAAHRTIEITTKQLIVRRGQPFLLTLEMLQSFSVGDTLLLTVETGPAPLERHGTRSQFGNPSPKYPSDAKAVWKYEIDRRAVLERGIVALSVTPPIDAPVGKYSLSAMTHGERKNLGTLVVLFNPWCSDDWVYLPDDRERQEYVMNEEGTVYTGTSDCISSLPWIFGQFEEEMVDICLKILDANLKHRKDPAGDTSARCNPIYVSRVISAMVNSNDDQGVLVGRWDGNYSDGCSPTYWTSSVSILQRWFQNRCSPVKYGQSWVFAAVMCTVMRFFGIPCRVVTNFQSAHDSNNSLTIDEYYDDYGVSSKETSESVWNFHVWVEGWMKRPDLMKGGIYDGWQVLDPTPQEKSEGVFCCGPAPVNAILRGDTDVKYDVPFVYAEVNADIVKWMISPDGSKKKMYTDTRSVGQKISTKAVGSWKRVDITDSYKHKEGTSAERAIFHRAVRMNSKEGHGCDIEEAPQYVEMRIEQETKVINGQDIKLRLKLSSKDHTSKEMTIRINAQAMRYYGKMAGNILNKVQLVTLLSGQDVTIPIQIPFATYSKYMVNCDSIKVSAVASDSDEYYQTETNFTLEQPVISMKALGPVQVDREMTLQVEFTNSLNEKLRNCSLTVNGCGLFKPAYVGSEMYDLNPKAKLQLTIITTPYKVGPKTVVANFSCCTFRDTKSTYIVEVKP